MNPCCCETGCGKCTHRQLTVTDFIWSDNVLRSASCDALVVDMVVLPGVGLYILARLSSGRYVVQRWSEAGVRVASHTMPVGFEGFRIDALGDKVWVCGLAPIGEPNVYALNAIGLAEIWSADDGGPSGSPSYSTAYDVEPDGAGGVFVARQGDGRDGGGAETCDEAPQGYVSHYNSSGALINRFGGGGGATARALLFDGMHLFVGSTPWATGCLCDGVGMPSTVEGYAGHLARFTGTAMNWFTGYQFDVTSGPNVAFVNRLAMVSQNAEDLGDRGRLFAFYKDDQGPCLLVEWNPETGEQIQPYSLDSDDAANPITIIEAAAIGVGTPETSGINAVAFTAGGLLWLMDYDGGNEALQKHSGAGLAMVTVEGVYRAVAISPGAPLADAGTRFPATRRSSGTLPTVPAWRSSTARSRLRPATGSASRSAVMITTGAATLMRNTGAFLTG